MPRVNKPGNPSMGLGKLCLKSVLVPLLLLLPITGEATSVRSVSVDEMLEESALIVEAEVVAVQTVVGDDPRAIHTCASLRVLDVIKGTAGEDPVELCFSGGTSGEVTRKVFGMVYPEVGETGVYFIYSLDHPLVNPLYGWHQGHFRIEVPSERPGGVVTTVQGREVIDLAGDSPDGKPASGAARGVVVRKETPLEAGRAATEAGPDRGRTDGNTIESDDETGGVPLTPEEFKARLRLLLEGPGE
jgi:hypothetical protein